MESEKMALMNLFSGQQWRNRHREQPYGHEEKGEGGCMEIAMATHSSALAWRIPGTGEPGGLPSMGSHRVGH